MNKKTILSILFVVGVLISACTISSSVITESAQGSTPTAQMRATSTQVRNVVAPPTSIPTQSNNASPTAQPASSQNNPPATAVPTKTSSAGGSSNSSNSANSAPVTISNITLYPQNAVYYGNCANNEETMANIQARLEPLDKISSATIYYGYNGPSGNFGNYSATMYQLGIGDYAAGIDVGLEADFPLAGNDGTLEVYIHAVDKNGKTIDSSFYSIPVKYCGGVVGQPLVGGRPSILYFTGPNPANATAGDTITLEWEVVDACKVFLNGDEMVLHKGAYSYDIPTHWGGQGYTAWGTTPCDNSNEVSADYDLLWVDTLPTTVSKGSGSIYDSQSLDVGDGNGDDVIFDHNLSDLVLYGVWGSKLKVFGAWTEPSIQQCIQELSSGSFDTVSIDTDQFICYKTGSGNYGYLRINGMYLDFDTLTNSYIDVSYYTEVAK